MTTSQIHEFVREMEHRWRSRTPTLDPNYSNPDYRVGRSEMVTWAQDRFGIQMDLIDSIDPDLTKAISKMWRRLKREFPDENWS